MPFTASRRPTCGDSAGPADSSSDCSVSARESGRDPVRDHNGLHARVFGGTQSLHVTGHVNHGGNASRRQSADFGVRDTPAVSGSRRNGGPPARACRARSSRPPTPFGRPIEPIRIVARQLWTCAQRICRESSSCSSNAPKFSFSRPSSGMTVGHTAVAQLRGQYPVVADECRHLAVERAKRVAQRDDLALCPSGRARRWRPSQPSMTRALHRAPRARRPSRCSSTVS